MNERLLKELTVARPPSGDPRDLPEEAYTDRGYEELGDYDEKLLAYEERMLDYEEALIAFGESQQQQP